MKNILMQFVIRILFVAALAAVSHFSTGCALFENTVKAVKIEQKITICDSAKISGLPKQLPDLPGLSRFYTSWNDVEKSYYIHACVSGTIVIDSTGVSGAIQGSSSTIEQLTEILKQVWFIVKTIFFTKE
jgi:hypothetical protein